jgi:hypothetical protein
MEIIAAQAEQLRVRRLVDQTVGQVEQHLQPPGPALAAKHQLGSHALALDLPLSLELQARLHVGLLRQRKPHHEDGRERRRERGELGTAGDERGEEAQTGQHGIGAELRRRRACHVAGSASALGVGTCSSSSAMTSSARSC